MYYVYIMTNKSNSVLYVGVTNDLERRISEHKNHVVKGFTQKYNVEKCVYYEVFNKVKDALAAEKTLKGWRRERKFGLINSMNPEMKDLSEE